jgi:hypothetical protein
MGSPRRLEMKGNVLREDSRSETNVDSNNRQLEHTAHRSLPLLVGTQIALTGHGGLHRLIHQTGSPVTGSVRRIRILHRTHRFAEG